MNLGWREASELVEELNKQSTNWPVDVQVIIAPPAPYLSGMVMQMSPNIALAAQNASEYQNGAYTGEISMSMLRSMGIRHCILGHSERRSYFHEDNRTVGNKVSRAVASGVIPI